MKEYRFDVALSYAGEDQRLVRSIYSHLIAEKARVFFAPMQASDLWGKDKRVFQRVFGPESKYVVPFVSKSYVRKDWPRLEFRAARKEARKRSEEFILPVRIDTAKLPGLRSDVQYVHARRYSAKSIARLLLDKLGLASTKGTDTAATSTGTRRPAVRVLTTVDADLLGLLATAVLPLDAESVKLLLPAVAWGMTIARWRRLGYLRRGTRRLSVAPTLKQQLLRTRADERRHRERWIDILKPLSDHIDMALVLAIQFGALHRTREMLAVLTPIAEGLEPGFWSTVYLRLFEALDKSARLTEVKARARIEFSNSYGTLLSSNGRYADALSEFARLRTLSKRENNLKGEGLSYINAGAAAAYGGNTKAAQAWNRKALAHGRMHHDPSLTWRALGNLANFATPTVAMTLLAESETIRRRAGDEAGLASTVLARGNVSAQLGDFATAVRHYRKAAALAQQFDMRFLRVLALRNLGRAEMDQGRPAQSLSSFRTAREIATTEGFKDEVGHAMLGEATAQLEAKHFRRAESVFSRLATLYRGDRKDAQEVMALHAIGVTRLRRNMRAEAFAAFSQAIDRAKVAGKVPRLYAVLIDAAATAPSNEAALVLLRRARVGAMRMKDHAFVLRCAMETATLYLAGSNRPAALRELLRTQRTAPIALRLELMTERLRIVLEGGSDRSVGAAFHSLVRAATTANDSVKVANAHMALGDFLWQKGALDERVNAYQAYAAGMLAALTVDFESAMKTGAHAVARLHLLFREDDRTYTLDMIEKRTIRWIERQAGTQKVVVRFALWPLRVARRILARPDLGKNIRADEASQLAKQEMELR